MKSPYMFLIIALILLESASTQINKNLLKIKGNKPRELSNNSNFEPIRVHPDFSYLKYQSNNDANLLQIEKQIEVSMTDTIKTLKKLVNVHPLSYPINKITYEDLNQWGFNQNNFNKLLLSNGAGVNTDLVIIFKFIESGQNNLLIDNEMASISNKFILDEITKRPIVGVIYLNPNINLNIQNVDIYLKSILLHELTHILGFHYNLFQYYPGGLEKTIKTEKEKRTKKNKDFIITPKVVDFAKKYFNCNEIDGVELENQHNLTSSHWEARILLGEYMTSSPYTPEQVISEFTLSLLEDSGWYKVNYYTGGLMRFGKNKGCEFLNKDCITNLNSNFKYEFCDFPAANQPTCSSGRQSRTYCKAEIKTNSKENIEYKRFGNFYGRANADNCPVSDLEIEEEKQIYYVGNCKYGNGKYGTHNNFGEDLSNEDFLEVLGEKYGSNSYCVLSSVLPEDKKNISTSYNEDTARALCYPMFCSSRSLSIQVFDQYIVCPREGGKVKISGKYSGYIICPDYNLICTGTQICNDMFDCVEKESLSREESYKYDYEINNNDEKIYNADEISELGDDGLCPKNCAQCENNKKCLKCLKDYAFVGQNKYSSSFECMKDEEIDSEKYCYKEDNVYYNCDWNVEKQYIDKKTKKQILEGNINDIIKKYIENTKYTDKLIVNFSAQSPDESSLIIYKENIDFEFPENMLPDDIQKISKLIKENNSNNAPNVRINLIIKQNDNYYISVHDEEGNKLFVNVVNNYENNLKKIVGTEIKNVISNNQINILNSDDKIFNDICSNFTVSGIDIPVNIRKNIFYLGEDKNKNLCGNKDCKLINDISNTNEAQCSCSINLNINDINLYDIKKNDQKEEASKKDFLKIFQCFDSKRLKVNEGFYISLFTLCIQSASFILYFLFTPKVPVIHPVANPGKKDSSKNSQNGNEVETEDNKLNKSDEKEAKTSLNREDIIDNHINSPQISNQVFNFGNIDEEVEEKCPEDNQSERKGTNDVKIDTIKIGNNNIKLEGKNLGQETRSAEENIELFKNIENLNTINTNTNYNQNNCAVSGKNDTMNNSKNSKNKDLKDSADEDFSLRESMNKKLKMKEREEDKEFEEKLKNNNEKVLYFFSQKNKNKTNLKNNKNADKKQNKDKNEEKEKNQILPLDYLPIEKAITYDKRSFGILYWSIFSFKQPLINMLSYLRICNITQSCIPVQMKLIRLLLMLILNIFINSMTITQNYFKDKYEHFNKKYQIEETDSDSIKIKIPPLERLSYAMNHCFPEVFITFVICMIVQFIINYIFFGIRRDLCYISINEKKEEVINREVQKVIKKVKVRYIIFAVINLILMVVFFIYLTNFSNAYSGGALDYIGAGIWTFIMLQILPFISSLIIALLRYYGMKKNSQGMYRISQILLA